MSKTPDIIEMTNKQNALIAERVVEFLRRRIQAYQMLIPKYLQDEKSYGGVITSSSFNDFMNRYNELRTKLYIAKEGKETLNASKELDDFERTSSNYITLTDEEVEELLSLVKESITKYGLGNKDFLINEAKFLERVLSQLFDADFNLQRKSHNRNYLRYAQVMAKRNTGFINKISGSFYWNLGYVFKIITDEEKELCNIDELAVDIREKAMAEEDILLADNLRVAKLLTRDEKKQCLAIFLATTIDGKPKLKQVRISDYFDINSSPLKDEILNSQSTEWYNMNDFLAKHGLGDFIDHIYNEEDLFNITHEFDKLQTLTEEQKQGICMAVETAVSYWISSFVDNGKFQTNKLSSLKKFMILLSKHIRKEIAQKTYYHMESRRYENNPLYKIGEEAGLDLYFANEDIEMWVTHKEVSIKSTITDEMTSLYKFGEEQNQGQGNGTCPKLAPGK